MFQSLLYLKFICLLAIMGLTSGVLQAAPAPSVAVISETVGQVGDYVVTSREVRITQWIEQVLYPSSKNEEGRFLSLTSKVTDSSFQAALTSVLLETVVSFEAQVFNLAEITDEELTQVDNKLQNAPSFKAQQSELEISNNELQRFIKRKLIAKKFLKFKTNSMVGVVTDADVKTYYDQNRSKFSGDSYTQYKENIRSYLMQQQLESRLRAWFEVIQRKYKVRNFFSDKPR